MLLKRIVVSAESAASFSWLSSGRGETGRRFGPVLLGHTFGMTIRTFHKVYVVRAGGGFERRVHGFDVEAAIGQSRVAIGAGGARFLPVSLVAGEATESLMHPHRRPIIA